MMLRRISRGVATKLFKTGEEALKDVKDGYKIFVAGFGVAGVAENCMRIMHKMKLKDLTIYSNSIGLPGWGPGLLIDHHQVSKFVGSFIGGNDIAEAQYLKGEIEIEYMPQGSLVERLRCRQAGIGGFFTPTGVGTVFEVGGFPLKFAADGSAAKVTSKFEKQEFDGKEYMLFPAYEQADVSCVKAFLADKEGNLRYRRTARNFNPNIAGAGRITIAEAEHIVDRLPPDKIHTPGCFVDRVFQGEMFTHKIERLRLREFESESESASPATSPQKPRKMDTRERIVRRALKELIPGTYINLGIGIPAELPAVLPENSGVTIQVENGLVNAGQYPYPDQIDADTINAAKEPITTRPGFSMSSSASSFGMMRGKHIHMTVLGGLQVSEKGDLANWMVPGKKAKGMGGAMDLAASVPNVVVTMEHTSGKQPRILPECTFPLTAQRCVSTLITELAVFKFVDGKMFLKEKVKELSLDQIKAITPANYIVDPNLKDYEI